VLFDEAAVLESLTHGARTDTTRILAVLNFPSPERAVEFWSPWLVAQILQVIFQGL
jgi:hypothetical protein